MTKTVGTQVASRARSLNHDEQLIRYFLGLPVDWPLKLLKNCRKLPNTSIKDVVFLSVDTENISAGQIPLAEQFQVGVSILDARTLQDHISSWPIVSIREDNLLKTQNYCVGPTAYCLKARRRFLFGQSETVHPDQIKEKIESLVGNRDVVLVVFAGYNDLWLVNELKVKLELVATVDLQKAAGHILQLQRSKSLSNLLIELECPFHFLHVAGNDANFTLRAFLMTAVRGSYECSLNDSQQAILSSAQEIAQSTAPHNWLEKRDHVAEEEYVYITKRKEMKRLKKETEKARKAARKAKLAAEGHWSSSKAGRQEFWARPENAYKMRQF